MLDPTGRNKKLSYRPLINSSVFLINMRVPASSLWYKMCT